jgi:hypothetical protein
MIYTDGIHLVSDESVEELHVFASKIGCKKHWFDHSVQKNSLHPHYNVWGIILRRALAEGAVMCTPREFVPIIKKIEAMYGGSGRSGNKA